MVWENTKEFWQRARGRMGAYLANADPLARAGNSGAFLVWSSQPLYPVYVWLLVGRGAWPALLTWLSTPFFFVAPIVGRRSSKAGRALFAIAGVANTLLAAKAFGPGSGVGWFLIPCLTIAAGFFRLSEWPVACGLAVMTGSAALLLGHLGAPLYAYTPAEIASLWRLNVWSVIVLSIYLVVTAVRAHRAELNRSASLLRSPR